MKQYTIHIPMKFNDGRDVPDITLREFLEPALDTFGGYTLNPVPMAGAWKDGDGTVYLDAVRQLYIATSDEEALQGYVWHAGSALKQLSMYVLETGTVELVNTDKERTV